MNRKVGYLILVCFSIIAAIIGFNIGNFYLYLIACISIISGILLFYRDFIKDYSKENLPPKLEPPIPEKPSNTPKLPYESKLEKADQMRNNPTPAEKRMWEILNANVAPSFPEHRFYPQSLQYGYILDFYFPSLKLAIEVDGDSHNNRRGYDWERDSNLAKYGIQVLRASNDEVFKNSTDLADSLLKIIEERNQELLRKERDSAHKSYSSSRDFENRGFRDNKYRRRY